MGINQPSSELIMKTIFCWPNLKEGINNHIILSNQGAQMGRGTEGLQSPHFVANYKELLRKSVFTPSHPLTHFDLLVSVRTSK